MSYRAVVNCRGHRCAALTHEHPAPGRGVLRECVARSREAVLVSTGCLGLCARSPVVGLGTAHHEDGQLVLGVATWIGPAGPEHLDALVDHLAEEHPDDPADQGQPRPLPEMLLSAAFTPVALPD